MVIKEQDDVTLSITRGLTGVPDLANNVG